MREQIKKYGIYVVALVLLLLVVHNCANNREHELKGEAVQLKEQLKKYKDATDIQEKNRAVLKDSFSREIKKIKEKEQNSKEKVLQLENKVVSLQSKLEKTKGEIKNYSNEQSAKAFNNRYGITSTTSDATSVNLKEDTPKKVLTELAVKDALEDNNQIKDSIIAEKDNIIEGKDKEIEMGKTLNAEADKTINLQKGELHISEQLIKNAEKQNKQLKVKNTVSKILVPIAFGLGFLLAK